MSSDSGFQAGYDWAQDHDITQEKQCPRNPNGSVSFTAGCLSYVQEQQRLAKT